MVATATLRLFGGFSLRGHSGEPVLLSLRKTEALIAFLAVAKVQRCSRDQIATLLWGDSPQSTALQSLRQARVTLLRDLLAHDLQFVAFGRREISLERAALTIDALEFAQLAERGDLASLMRAAALYRGDFLSGCEVGSEAFDEWLQPTRAWYREQVETALAKLILLQEQTGASDAAIQSAKHLLAINPLREDIHRWLMRAYAAKGQRSSALASYEACRSVLRNELAIEPEVETDELYKAIQTQGPLPQERPPIDGVVPPRPPLSPTPPDEGADFAIARATGRQPISLSSLSALAVKTIQVAAVTDGRCAKSLVAFVTDLSEAQIEEAVNELGNLGLLQCSDDGESMTVPEPLRTQIVDSLLPSHRKHLHYAIALALEEKAGSSLSDSCYDVASHYRAAGTPERAVPHALKSGQLEVDRGNFDLADAQYARALDDLQYMAPCHERSCIAAETKFLRANVAELRGDLEQADDLLSQAMPAIKQHPDLRLLTATLLAKSRLYRRRGRLDRAYGCIRLAAQHPNVGMIDGTWLLTERFAYFANLLTGGSLPSGRALAIAQQRVHAAGRRSSEADVAALQSLVDASRERFALAYASSTQAIQIADELADTTSQIVALQALGQIQAWDGDAAAALEQLDRARVLAIGRGDLVREYTSRGYRGFALLNAGRWSEAVAELGEALSMSERLGLRFMQAMFMAWLAEALIGFGDLDKALVVARTAVRLATESNQPWPRSVASRALAQAVALSSAGERSLADRLIRAALETQSGLGLPLETARSLVAQELISNSLH